MGRREELDRSRRLNASRSHARGATARCESPDDWIVRGDDLYVRSLRGTAGGGFRAARQTHDGHISASGVEKDVRFLNADDDVNDAVDEA